MPALNYLLHVDLVVSNAERSIAFYAKCLGATVADDTVLHGALAQFYSNGTADQMRLVLLKLPSGHGQVGQMIELLELPNETPARDPELAARGGRGQRGIRNFTVAVEDLDETVAELARAGITPRIPITALRLPKLGDSRLTFIADPDDNLIELVEPLKVDAAQAPSVPLPTDHPRQTPQAFELASVNVSLDAELTADLASASARFGATLEGALLAAFSALLARYSAESVLTLGVTTGGGAPLPVRATVKDDKPFAELAAELSKGAASAGAAKAQRFQLLFCMGGAATPAPFDVALSLAPSQHGISGELRYNAKLFDTATMSRWVGHLTTLLKAASASSGEPLWALPILPAAERQQLLVEWNETRKDYPLDQGLHQLIEAQAAKTPDAVAIRFEGSALSYRELNARANQLARGLVALGVGPDVPVAIFLERSLEVLVSLLAILKAGGAYLPLDPDYPADRLAFMLADAEPPVLLTQQSLVSKLGNQKGALFVVDRDFDRVSNESTRNLAPRAKPDDLAYIIYTSGSTGRPKGAMNTHRAICNRLLWMQEAFELTPADTVLQKTPLSFDVSVWELFWPLLTGASIVFAKPSGHKDNGYLVDLICREKITVLHFVPSMMQAFLEEKAVGSCTSLAKVMSSGEALPSELTERFFAKLDAELHNLYGPTEAAVDVTHWPCSRADGSARSVPIGRPIANVKMHVLDPHQQPVPIGVQGELHIGGICLARGYLKRDSLTRERFIPDPFGPPGARLYRTGDLARYRSDGAIEYLGRIDNQIKLRGFRIELGEIEAVACQHPDVREAAVIATNDALQEKTLVAYLVKQAGAAHIDEGAVRAFLKGRLPEYMVPSVFVRMDALPLTSSGKVDRKALPPPDFAKQAEDRPFLEPQTPVEKKIAQLWAKIRKLPRVGLHDNFFETGGNSISITRLATRISESFEVNLAAGPVFMAPTVQGVAALVEAALQKEKATPSQAGALSPFKVTATPGSREHKQVPLSFTEERHFRWWQQATEHVFGRVTLRALWISGPLSQDALQTALNQLTRRHDLLRSTYRVSGTSVMREITPPRDAELIVVDCQGLADPEAAAIKGRDDQVLRKFDLTREPPLRVTLFQVAPERALLCIAMDHSSTDAEGFRLIIAELKALYGQALNQQSAGDEPPVLQYADFALWQRALFADEALVKTERAFWESRLLGAQPITRLLPTDLPRAPLDEARAVDYLRGSTSKTLFWRAPAHLSDAVQTNAGRQNATLFTAAFAAFALMLARRAKVDELVVSTLNDYRRRVSGLDGVMGAFNNSTMLKLNLSGAPSYAELIGRAQADLNEVNSHIEFPLVPLLFPRLNDHLRLVFNFLPPLVAAAEWANCTATPAQQQKIPDSQAPKTIWDLNFVVWTEESFAGTIIYNTELWNDATALQMRDEYLAILDAMAKAPNGRV